MDAESLEEILERQYRDAAEAFDEVEGDERPFQEQLEEFVRALQHQAYGLGLANGQQIDGDVVNLTLDQEAGWNLARNLLYGAPITISITR